MREDEVELKVFVPVELKRKLKILSVLSSKSMKELVIEALEKTYSDFKFDRYLF